MKSLYKNYIIYTDGSCKGGNEKSKDNAGAWAYEILLDGEVIAKDCEGEYRTTNNRMEMMAVLNAAEMVFRLSKNDPTATYTFNSDSSYVVNCWAKEWYKNWERNGWVNSKKAPVENEDLWRKIIPYFKNKSCLFYKVEGHSTDVENNKMDNLAQTTAKRYLEKLKDMTVDEANNFWRQKSPTLLLKTF